MKKIAVILSVLLLFSFCACAVAEKPADSSDGESVATNGSPDQNTAHTVKISGDVPGGDTVADLSEIAEKGGAWNGDYSLVNNWPTKKTMSASGVTLEAILEYAGVKDSFKQVRLIGEDGYFMSFTREQALAGRFYFPGIMEDDSSGASDAPMILAFSKSDAAGADGMEDCPLTLIFGQENIFERNSPAFVEGVAEIEISDEDPGRWDAPSGFPQPGELHPGDTVKLQHPEMGKVMVYYTTGGEAPGFESSIYNPSTYRPELTVPLEIYETITIRAVAVGYGRGDSEVAVLEYTVNN